MMTKQNKVLLSILLVIIGSILFVGNVQNIMIFYGSQFVGIVLMLGPSIYFILLYNKHYLNTNWLILITLIPLLILSLIFIFNSNLPVGFTDNYLNIMAYDIIFKDPTLIQYLPNISLNFIGMYILSNLLNQILGFTIIQIAAILPIIITITTYLLLYIIINKIFNRGDIALLGTIFYGTNYNILLFSHEFRTQPFGMVSIFIVVFILYLSIFYKDNKTIKVSSIIVIVVTLCSITLSGFTPATYLFVILIAAITVLDVTKLVIKRDITKSINLKSILAIFTILIISYLIFISNGFLGVIETTINLSSELWSSQVGSGQGFGGALYGSFVDYGSYVFRIVAIISLLALLIYSIVNQDIPKLLFTIMFSSILIFSLISGIFGVGLSVSRAYTAAFILLGSASAWFILNQSNIYNKLHMNKVVKIKIDHIIIPMSLLLIFFIVFVNILSFPNYLIGDTEPLRGEELIDDVVYWKSDDQQYALCSFLNNSDSKLESQVIIKNNILLRVLDNNYSNNNILTILHDKSGGEYYTYRDILPPNHEFFTDSRVYSNTDYLVYYK